eukprot:15204796-Alexandrium_andersonii.AAC.1
MARVSEALAPHAAWTTRSPERLSDRTHAVARGVVACLAGDEGRTPARERETGQGREGGQGQSHDVNHLARQPARPSLCLLVSPRAHGQGPGPVASRLKARGQVAGGPSVRPSLRLRVAPRAHGQG